MAKQKTIKLSKNAVLNDLYNALHLLEQKESTSNKSLLDFINSFSFNLAFIEDNEIKELNTRIVKKLDDLGLYDDYEAQ